MSQCFKWREDLSPELRVQMVESNKKHWYIYEPVELKSRHIVVPIFFFLDSNQLQARCVLANLFKDGPTKVNLFIPPNLHFKSSQLRTVNVSDFAFTYQEIQLPVLGSLSEACGHKLQGNEFSLRIHYKTVSKLTIEILKTETNDSTKIHPLPNPWRVKAKGRLIRHVPISLYADHTSGNISKQFNKHIAYYFTLAGLPPNLSNMEYNCHFLCTSNTSGALELGEQVVDQLKYVFIIQEFIFKMNL